MSKVPATVASLTAYMITFAGRTPCPSEAPDPVAPVLLEVDDVEDVDEVEEVEEVEEVDDVLEVDDVDEVDDVLEVDDVEEVVVVEPPPPPPPQPMMIAAINAPMSTGQRPRRRVVVWFIKGFTFSF